MTNAGARNSQRIPTQNSVINPTETGYSVINPTGSVGVRSPTGTRNPTGNSTRNSTGNPTGNPTGSVQIPTGNGNVPKFGFLWCSRIQKNIDPRNLEPMIFELLIKSCQPKFVVESWKL